jgi:hypothetical protein
MLSTNFTPPLNSLYRASLSPQYFFTATSSTSAFSFPGLFTTYALGISTSGSSLLLTPITAASMMLGCVKSTVSSSGGATWNPRTLMSSFLRSTMYHFLVFPSQYTISPVLKKPSESKDSAFAVGFSKYPDTTIGPRTHSSPRVS